MTMERIKQIMITLLAVMILAGYKVYPANAAEQVRFSLTGMSGGAGEEVELPVNIYNDSEVAGIDIIISYEPEVFKCNSVQGGNILNAGYFDINHDEKAGTVHLVYVALSGLKEEGPLLTLKGTYTHDITGLYSPQIEVVEIVNASENVDALPYMVERDGQEVENMGEAAGSVKAGSTVAGNTEASLESVGEKDSQGKADSGESVEKTESKDKKNSSKRGITKSKGANTETNSVSSHNNKPFLIIGLFSVIIIGVVIVIIKRKKGGKTKK